MTSLNDTRWRKYAAATGLFAGFLLSPTLAFANCTDAPVDDAIYKVVNKGSNLLLNVDNASTSSGANINTISNNGDASQRFYMRYQSSSHYWTMEAAHTGMLVDVANDSTSNGGNVIQASDDDGTSQEWELKQQSDGSYRIVNRNSSYSLTVAGSDEGSSVYQNADAGYSSQRWWLEPVSYTCGSSSDSSSDSATDGIELGGTAGDGKVSLSWTSAPSGTQVVQIYYDTDSDPSGRARAATLSVSDTSYTVTSLSNGTPYWFWVKYQNADGTWDNSNAFNATPAGSSSSGSDGITLGGSASDGQVSLSWSAAPSGTQRVEVYYDTDSNPGGRTKAAVLSTSDRSYTVSGLSNGTPYWFWVKYQKADGTWDNSNAFNATPSSSGSGSSSEGITLGGSAGDGKVSLSWSAAPSGTQAVEVYYDTDSNPGGRTKAAMLSVSTTSYTVSGLSNGTPYWFWVKYQKADGTWDNSNAFNATPNGSSSDGSSSGFKVTGFASISGTDGLSTTIGGAGGSTVTVDNCSDLKSSLKSSSALTIQIPSNTTLDCRTSGTSYTACQIECPSNLDAGDYTYRIPTSTLSCSDLGAVGTKTVYRYDQQYSVASNKTLVGLGSGSTIKGVTLKVSGAKNVIIRNLNISEVNPHLVEGGDGVSISDSSHVVVDHVKFNKISDGHIDIKNSLNVTASYNQFDGYNSYVCGDKHWYTNAVSDSQVTFHHNYWKNAAGRNPKLEGSNTRAHLYNNYWNGIYYYSVGVDKSAQALLEYNYFDDAARPHWNIGSGYIDANVSTNVYTGQSASGSYAVQDTGNSVLQDVNMYSYSKDSASSLTNLTTETGAQ